MQRIRLFFFHLRVIRAERMLTRVANTRGISIEIKSRELKNLAKIASLFSAICDKVNVTIRT